MKEISTPNELTFGVEDLFYELREQNAIANYVRNENQIAVLLFSGVEVRFTISQHREE